MNNASPFLPPIPKKKKEKKDASLGWWCHLEAKVFCYVKPDRGVGFDRLFNCELFFLQGNWHLFAHITPSQSGKMNTDSSNIRRKWAEKRECVALSIVISSQWYIYIFTHFTCLSGPLVAVCGKTLFLKVVGWRHQSGKCLRQDAALVQKVTCLLKMVLIEPKEIFLSRFLPPIPLSSNRATKMLSTPVLHLCACTYMSSSRLKEGALFFCLFVCLLVFP